jgi:ribosomal 50S subunit-recycling heat shock protein
MRSVDNPIGRATRGMRTLRIFTTKGGALYAPPMHTKQPVGGPWAARLLSLLEKYACGCVRPGGYSPGGAGLLPLRARRVNMARNKRDQVQEAQSQEKTMRLDKYLKVSRIIKRRSVASDACDTGHVLVGGKEAKPGANVKVGDVISVRFGDKLTRYEVVTLNEHVLKADAAGMYRILA